MAERPTANGTARGRPASDLETRDLRTDPEFDERDKPEDEPFLSVVLPCYRDAALLARHVPPLRRHLEALSPRFEIIVCDDGSDDGGRTRETAGALGCHYVANPTNRGKGAALRRGMRHARGRHRIFSDADVR